MSSPRDYYGVLGVDRKADAEEIKKAFRQAALKWHPDRNPGNAEAETRFKEVAAAYAVLSDEKKRAQYDQFGHRAFGPGGQEAGPTFTNMEDIFAHFGDIFGSGVFGDLFGGRSRGGPRRGRDLKIVLDLTLEEIDSGVQRTVSLKRLEHCGACQGSGARPGTSPVSCATCGGRGQIHRNQGFFTMATTCPRCRGQGSVIESPCSTCRGAGAEQRKSDVQITIPPGIEEGVRLRVPGQGDAGDPGAPRGDLYCLVRESEHRLFQRSGADLMCELPFSFTQLALGDKIEVPTLRGRATMTLPAGTQSGKVFRLKGQGLPRMESGGRGDQLVRAFVEVPRRLTERQKELLHELSEIERRESGNRSFFEKITGYFK